MNYYPKILVDRLAYIKAAQSRTDFNPTYNDDSVYEAYLELVRTNKLNYDPHIICHSNETLHSDILYNICTISEIRKIVEWICTNIVSGMINMKYSTIDVKIRIAICMMNKLVDNNIINKDCSIEIGCNLYTNIRDLDKSLICAQLPF